MKRSKATVRALGALGEAVLVYVASLHLMSALFQQPWRTWIDDAAWARATPALMTALCTLALFRLSRQRYALPESDTGQATDSRGLTHLFVAVSLCAAPMTLVLGIARFEGQETLQLVTISALVASLVNILCIALTEEFLYRYVLLSRLLQVGVPVLLSVAIQAGFFLVAHGKHAFISLQTAAWYLVGGLTLGTLYVATRSIACSVALHCIVDICVAQTGPVSYWLTHRSINALSHDWTFAATGVWSTALLVYWVLATRSTAAFTDDPAGKLLAQTPPVSGQSRRPRPRGESAAASTIH